MFFSSVCFTSLFALLRLTVRLCFFQGKSLTPATCFLIFYLARFQGGIKWGFRSERSLPFWIPSLPSSALLPPWFHDVSEVLYTYPRMQFSETVKSELIPKGSLLMALCITKQNPEHLLKHLWLALKASISQFSSINQAVCLCN